MDNQELPIELECFLIQYGFFESDKMPDFEPYRFKPRSKDVMFVSTTPARRNNRNHAPVFIAEPKQEYVAWTPSYENEEPPF